MKLDLNLLISLRPHPRHGRPRSPNGTDPNAATVPGVNTDRPPSAVDQDWPSQPNQTPNATIKNSIVMGCDYYDARTEVREVALEIGEGSVIEGAIIDKNVSMGSNVRIVNQSGRDQTDLEHPTCVIRDGIPIVIKNSVLPDGWDLEQAIP